MSTPEQDAALQRLSAAMSHWNVFHSTEERDAVTSLLKLLSLIGLLFAGTVLKALVMAQLWAWYVSPVFGVPHLRAVYAFGLSLLLTYAANTYDIQKMSDRMKSKDSKDKSIDWHLYKTGFILSGVVLAFGWLGTFFI